MSGLKTFAFPAAAANIFIWHQGALGDVLLAGPALQAVADFYQGACLTLAGGPETLGLMADSLPVAAVWNTQRAVWLELFQDEGEVARDLKNLLAPFDLALVFSSQQQPEFLSRLRQAGVPAVFWLPSFPLQARVGIRELQEERLRAAGLNRRLEPFRLAVPEVGLQEARAWLRNRGGDQAFQVALAPGSGHPRKNWPLDFYVDLAIRLEEQCQALVWWVLGPAERGLEIQLQQRLPLRQVRLLANVPLKRLAAVLAAFQLYVGNDSGVTHLAAAVDGPAVAAIFGPSDPVVWAPPGDRTVVITPELPCAPCTAGREIRCPDSKCLSDLPPAAILAAIQRRWPELFPAGHR